MGDDVQSAAYYHGHYFAINCHFGPCLVSLCEVIRLLSGDQDRNLPVPDDRKAECGADLLCGFNQARGPAWMEVLHAGILRLPPGLSGRLQPFLPSDWL